jgi:hypothetical protein
VAAAMILYNPVNQIAKAIVSWLYQLLFLHPGRAGKFCFANFSIKQAVIFIILLQPFSKIFAQQETNYAVHANIIYRFTKYIDWPSAKKNGDFIIGIVGETPLYEELKSATAGKIVGSQKIVIKKFQGSETSFVSHILFISEEESSLLKKIIIRTATQSTLIVSETDRSTPGGSCINLRIARDRLKLEINKNNIEKRGLGIATELLQLGTIVN